MATNPMHQFNVHRIGPEIKLGNLDISFTQTVGELNIYLITTS